MHRMFAGRRGVGEWRRRRTLSHLSMFSSVLAILNESMARVTLSTASRLDAPAISLIASRYAAALVPKRFMLRTEMTTLARLERKASA